MPEVKIISANQLQKGSYIIVEGVACRVTTIATSRPGKHGHAKVRLDAVGVLDDKKRNIVMPGHENVEVPVIEKRNAQVLSIKDGIANIMDSESFETMDLKITPDIEGGEVEVGSLILYWDVMGTKVIKQVRKE